MTRSLVGDRGSRVGGEVMGKNEKTENKAKRIAGSNSLALLQSSTPYMHLIIDTS